ncbi:hypothetical protein ZWY2020_008047 [Hordeum vulgare]|nr:hypothetical protein ZWY2020_008047 [Hordeum vulgare]
MTTAFSTIRPPAKVEPQHARTQRSVLRPRVSSSVRLFARIPRYWQLVAKLVFLRIDALSDRYGTPARKTSPLRLALAVAPVAPAPGDAWREVAAEQPGDEPDHGDGVLRIYQSSSSAAVGSSVSISAAAKLQPTLEPLATVPPTAAYYSVLACRPAREAPPFPSPASSLPSAASRALSPCSLSRQETLALLKIRSEMDAAAYYSVLADTLLQAGAGGAAISIAGFASHRAASSSSSVTGRGATI